MGNRRDVSSRCAVTPILARPRAIGLAVAAAALALAAALVSGRGALAAADAPISISSVSASFFPNPSDSGSFQATPQTPVTFTQEFPVINFNPPEGIIKCTQPTSVGTQTHPFSDVVLQPDGSCKTMPAQSSNGNAQAGAGDMNSFQAVFTGTFVVNAPGRITFNMYSDDGWVLSIGASAGGAQPQYVSGPNLAGPKTGTFTGFAVVGSFNVVSAPNENNLVVAFPAGGSFPFELDYSECCDGDLALTVTGNNMPIPPIAGLAIDVRGVTDGAQIQGKQHIEVVGTTGQPTQVEFVVDGASRQTVRTPPFAFDWDASQESVGAHNLIVRAIDSTGSTAEKQVAVQVVPAAAPVVAPTVAPAPTLASTVVALPATPTQPSTSTGLIAAAIAILVLALAGVAAYFFFLMRKSPEPEPAPVVAAPAPVVAPVVEDRTEFLGAVPLAELTMVGNRRPQVLPKARLLVRPDREIPLSRTTDTVIGRDATNAAHIDDRQASRKHARVVCVDDDFWIEDLNSTNGTRVNGAAVTKQKLSDKDQIGVGDTLIIFSIDKA